MRKLPRINQYGLEKKQLSEATEENRISDRSFVLAVDEDRGTILLRNTSNCLKEFENANNSKTFDTSEWMGINEWFLAWISGEIGPISRKNDTNSVEEMLKKYVIPTKKKSGYKKRADAGVANLEETPPVAWVQLNLSE